MNVFDTKLADHVKEHASLLNFLDRLDIALGIGDKTVREICEEYDIDIYFFSELLQLITKKNEFNPRYIHKFNINHTVKYLRNSHHSYQTAYLPDLKSYIDKLENLEEGRKKDCELLNKYFSDYRREFLEHLEYEDGNIFPYILELERSYTSGDPDSSLLKRVRENPISNYVKKHSSLDEQLSDLKNLLIKYFKPFEHASVVRSLLKVLYELENDLKLHELIENQVLFPQVKIIEEKLIKNKIEK